VRGEVALLEQLILDQLDHHRHVRSRKITSIWLPNSISPTAITDHQRVRGVPLMVQNRAIDRRDAELVAAVLNTADHAFATPTI